MYRFHILINSTRRSAGSDPLFLNNYILFCIGMSLILGPGNKLSRKGYKLVCKGIELWLIKNDYLNLGK